MRVAILGLGQIGGSVGRALVAAGDPWRVVGWTRSEDARRVAAADGIEPATSIGNACAAADIVLLAVPPLACLELIDALGGPGRDDLAAGAVISDVASTKAAICDRAASHGLRFVGGHPMAGREASGYGAADSGLFAGRPWVVVPPRPADADAEARVAAMATACGADVVRLDAAEHDAAVAAISHLPLVLAAALVEAIGSSADWTLAQRLAAGGWAGMTRLARGDVAMGTGILATNGPMVAERLRDLRRELDGWLADLDSMPPDPVRLGDRLASARKRIATAETGGGE
ncbi:MAG TPA: prephenate dehydrogenase/arogenate dehydrogenase family protein [Candidatus Limnocylindrales bacterium]|nr:prephenate dehydrogenase/arogenate dehydrogenase family protein [Candidatus Limnocylindrales bacterium]